MATDSEVVDLKVQEAGPIPNNNIHAHVRVRQMLCRGVREKIGRGGAGGDLPLKPLAQLVGGSRLSARQA